MKKIFVTMAIAVAVGLGLSACAVPETAERQPVQTYEAPKPKPVPEAAPAPVEPAPQSSGSESTYLEVLSSDSFFAPLVSLEPDLLLETGYLVCEALDAGASIQDTADAATSSDIPAYSAGVIIGAAITNLCPEYLPMAEEYLNGG